MSAAAPATGRSGRWRTRTTAARSGPGRARMASSSGRHELVIVAMDAVAQPPAGRVTGNWHRPHDLANRAAAAEEVAAPRHPMARVGRVGVELERAGVDGRRFGPVDRALGRDDVEDVEPPRRALDDLAAPVAPNGDVVLDDRRDPDAHDLHR